MWARIRSTLAGWAPALAAQSQSRSAGAGLKIVFVFFLVAFSSQDYDGDEDHCENAGDELDRSLGHFCSWRPNRKYKTKHGRDASYPLNPYDGWANAAQNSMKISLKNIRRAWKYRALRPLWRHRKEIGAGTVALAAIGAGILFGSKGIKRPSEAK
jgi:hypothetical protein